MNKIYNLFDEYNNPYVSNILVSDIRDDINSAYTLCEFNNLGIKYTNYSKKNEDEDQTEKITHFDLVLYPFNTIVGLNNKKEYENSFICNTGNIFNQLKTELELSKTLSHVFKQPALDDITCIKNYLKLNARITTTYRVNSIEQETILNNIYSAIYSNFNARKVDFGEEIPYDSILEVIENADPHIKNVSLEEPALYTAVQIIGDNNTVVEYADPLANVSMSSADFNTYLNKLILRNVLAGKVALFNYNDKLFRDYTETRYGIYDSQYGGTDDQQIKSITSSFDIENYKKDTSQFTLTNGEVISFRAPNFKTVVTYPAYVNYYFHKEDNVPKAAAPATMLALNDFFTGNIGDKRTPGACIPEGSDLTGFTLFTGLDSSCFEESTDESGPLFGYSSSGAASGSYFIVQSTSPFWELTKYKPKITEGTWRKWKASIAAIKYKDLYSPDGWSDSESSTIGAIYEIDSGADPAHKIGKLIDIHTVKYKEALGYTEYNNIYIPQVHSNDKTTEDYTIYERYTKTGLGQNGTLAAIPNGTEYQLQDNDYLLVNYTTSTTALTESTGETTTTQTVINKYYGKGTIIRPTLDEKTLLDTAVKINQTDGTYTKSKDFDFTKYHKSETSGGITEEPAGMLTLDINEKIEIRDLAKVSLYDPDKANTKQTANVFWILQDSSYTDSKKEDFPFDNNEYILKENEMFYYTDEKNCPCFITVPDVR